MDTYYEKIQTQLLAAKPRCEQLIAQMRDGEITLQNPYHEFFNAYRLIVLQAWNFAQKLEADPLFKNIPLKELQQMNADYYASLDPDKGYEKSLANPDYAHKLYGDKMGAFLSAAFNRAYSSRYFLLMGDYANLEITLNLYFRLLDNADTPDYEAWLAIYREETQRDLEFMSKASLLSRFSPEQDYFYKIVRDADLDDIRYLYRYGFYLSEHDLKMADFMRNYPPQELAAIAKFLVKSWVDGFVRAKKDYSKKKYATLLIPAGMEALGRLVIDELNAIGIQALVPRPHTMGINRQHPYDHRYDNALNLDREYMEKSLKAMESSYEELKDLIALQAGPLYVELFGETPFSPKSKSTCLKLSEEQQKLSQEQNARFGQIYYKYYKRDEASFTIIAFPSTEIGENFPEIFADTLKINLLDSAHYAKIQQHIIDVLDTADYVHVQGKPGNDTDIKVQMHKLKNPNLETLFENCVADVNIPVGEVFTSPVLEGTTGTLHVEDIYLNGLRFFNLRVHFEDGWVKDYSCTNYDDPIEAKNYVHENLLLPHKTLPIGEFAIGTNTTAYQIAKKHDIMSLLPILIIEKMGPHFAIGDTCFSHEEDSPHPSFVNGKEMIAVENEHSATRKTDPVNAYLMAHLDITLPYEMLKVISAVHADGTRTDIIRDGRFVIPGTEELNIPLIEMEQ
ncbi:MAG: aminopeptidase [Candidatus Cloacimonetes bacterium]|nr:aminopeptidase [Candidatus Cloacimonadota bacterium]